MKILILVTILFLRFFSVNAQQYIVTGKITDAENGKVIVNATVCLKQSNQCTATDEKGNYNLQNVKPGSYDIVVSSLGYKRIEKDITVTEKVNTCNLKLKATVGVLDSVKVKK